MNMDYLLKQFSSSSDVKKGSRDKDVDFQGILPSPSIISTHAVLDTAQAFSVPPVSTSIITANTSLDLAREKEAEDLEAILDNRRAMLEKHRLHCSEIVPGFLYVAGQDVAQNISILRSVGITHIVNCAGPQCPNYHAGEGDLIYTRLDMFDDSNEDVTWFMYKAFDAIREAQAAGGKVLLHCVAGVSRSCSLAIGWLMHRSHLSYQNAYNEVRAHRPVCAPNAAFICGLLEWQTRRTSSKPSPRLYRIAYHSILLPHNLVLKLCLDPTTRAPLTPMKSILDSRSCFLIIADSSDASTSNDTQEDEPATPSSMQGSRLYLWCGKRRRPEMEALAKDAVRWLIDTEGCVLAAGGPVMEGAESAEFLAVLATEKNAAQLTRYIDLEPLRSHNIDVVRTREDAAAEPTDGDHITSNKSQVPTLYECLAADDSDSNQSGKGFIWSKIAVYDDQDLVPEACYVLVCDDKTSSDAQTTVYGWVGEDFPLPLGPGQDLKDFLLSVSPPQDADWNLNSDCSQLIVEIPGEESDEFWTKFELGY